jgi:hypothetical protein
MSYKEIYNLIDQYKNTDKSIIKANLKRIMWEKGFKSADIMKLGYQKDNCYSWTNSAAKNCPLFEQAVHLAANFDFDVEELLKIS